MPRSISIYSSLLASILLLIVLLSGGILITTLFGASQAADKLSESVIDDAAAEVRTRLRGFFDPAVHVLALNRRWAEDGLLDLDKPEQLERQLAPILHELPQISSLLFADANGRQFQLLRDGDLWQSRDIRRPGVVLVREWNGAGVAPVERRESTDYDPRARPWFVDAVREPRGTVRWTAPYMFATTKRLGITASVAFERNGVVHVLGFDILLHELSAFTKRISSGERRAFVLTEGGRVVAFPERIAGAVLEQPDELGLPVLSASTKSMSDRLERTGAPVRFEANGEAWWGAQRSFSLSPERRLFIAVVTPESALVRDFTGLRMRILLVTVVVMAVAVLAGLFLARRYGRPIEALVRASDRIRRGDLSPSEPVRTRVSEFRDLAAAQERMRKSLRTLMRMERDLQVARQIQQSTFPRALPQPDNFEIEAWSEPADETGGDTYDVLGVARHASSGTVMILGEQPDSVLALLADATGHGIGPALSVTQVRAMLRMGVRSDVPLADIVRRMNEQLCVDLDEGRFVTLWLGELHPHDSILHSLSAGQGPIMHYVSKDDRFDVLDPQGPPIGVMPDQRYNPAPPLVLEPGDLYAVFSDGIYEARDAEKRVFGGERAQAVLREHRTKSAREILEALRRDLKDFTGDAPAEDDQTVILIKRV